MAWDESMGSMGKKNETRGRSGKKNPFENDTVRRRCTTSKCLLPALEERTLAPKGVCRDVYAEQLQPRHCNKKRKQIFLSSLPSSFFSFLKRSKAKKKKKTLRTNELQTKPNRASLRCRRGGGGRSLSFHRNPTAKRLTYCTERVQWKY